jgi:hypothetical protein
MTSFKSSSSTLSPLHTTIPNTLVPQYTSQRAVNHSYPCATHVPSSSACKLPCAALARDERSHSHPRTVPTTTCHHHVSPTPIHHQHHPILPLARLRRSPIAVARASALVIVSRSSQAFVSCSGRPWQPNTRIVKRHEDAKDARRSGFKSDASVCMHRALAS